MAQLFAVLFVVGVVIVIVRAVWKIVVVVGVIVLSAWIAYRVGRYVLKERYFRSEKFLAHKNKLASVVAEHNEIAAYVSEIHSQGSFSLGASASGTYAHLATFQNTSQHQYRPGSERCELQRVERS
ncbi:hypothetical protein [Mycobacterium asiaticum]|uniref:hypothetical protein n=1 Tax=Mycobacterium asiaticum TaxID=1790 RepID=UPI000A539FFC|nr:hypothetical protein [Mycobacterium asiaticum]